ncbi:MAG: hypothetical protein [Bacteriophage sp.]|nr:MAG: hypothetical protein [Bacteriophage sp.]
MKVLVRRDIIKTVSWDDLNSYPVNWLNVTWDHLETLPDERITVMYTYYEVLEEMK